MPETPNLKSLQAHFEKELVKEFPTPALIQSLIDKGYFEATSLARIITHLAYYAFRDTSDINRTTKSLSTLIGFCGKADSLIITGVAALQTLNDLADGLVVAGKAQQEAALN